MNIQDECRSLLEGAGYRTATQNSAVTALYFEDGSVLGAVFVHESVSSLVSSWEGVQDLFLGTNSASLRADPIKAWNIYTIHLTPAAGTKASLSQCFDIEQDFRGTRKIARTSIIARADLVDAMLPLLGLQHKITLSQAHVVPRIRDRLAALSPTLAGLATEVSDLALASMLMEAS